MLGEALPPLPARHCFIHLWRVSRKILYIAFLIRKEQFALASKSID